MFAPNSQNINIIMPINDKKKNKIRLCLTDTNAEPNKKYTSIPNKILI